MKIIFFALFLFCFKLSMGQTTCGVAQNNQVTFSTRHVIGPFPASACQTLSVTNGWYAPNADNIQSYVLTPSQYATFNSTGTVGSFSSGSSPNTTNGCFKASNIQVSTSQVYFVYLCKNILLSCTIFLDSGAVCTSNPTNPPSTITPSTPSPSPTTPSPTPTSSPSNINWAGRYSVKKKNL